MLEAVLEIEEQARLVEEIGGLEMGEERAYREVGERRSQVCRPGLQPNVCRRLAIVPAA